LTNANKQNIIKDMEVRKMYEVEILFVGNPNSVFNTFNTLKEVSDFLNCYLELGQEFTKVNIVSKEE
jgi:hypothetical protein